MKKKEYEKTQPYLLGKKYKELGELLMDEKTDLRDLAAFAHDLGAEVRIVLDEPPQKDEE